MTTRLSPGDAAPDFALQNDAGETVRLSDLRGQKVISQRTLNLPTLKGMDGNPGVAI